MPRFILIDNNSGYVFGEVHEQTDLTPAEAARLFDVSICEQARNYVEHASSPRTTVTGYHVYRADAGGSKSVAVVTDGQDQGVIDAVERDCEYVAFVECVGTDA